MAQRRTTSWSKVKMAQGADQYVTVAANSNNALVGHGGIDGGSVGDYLDAITAVVANATVSGIQLQDGTNSVIQLLPNAVGGGIGTYHIPLGLSAANGAWRILTNNGVSVIARGIFSHRP